MTLSLDQLRAAHKHSSNHRDEIARSGVCGCFYCETTFAPDTVVQWIDNGQCAVCPNCGIDSVIGDASGLPVADPQFMSDMNLYWFTPAEVPSSD